MNRRTLTRAHHLLIGVIAAGACAIAAIGFYGSYHAVRDLARNYGFGPFASFVPIGVDAGIVVLLALDLLLSWLRIPYPTLRRCAWALTAATIYLNGRTATDPTSLVLHAVLPGLFVIIVEAGRHAVARLAGIQAGQAEMEGLGKARWFLSPFRTFGLWRRKALWGITSRDEALRAEQQRLVYRSKLKQHLGRGWRRKAGDGLTPLQLAQLGVPLHLTYRSGFEAAGVEAGDLAVLFTDPKADSPLALEQHHTEAPGELESAEKELKERVETLEMGDAQRAFLTGLVQDALAQVRDAQPPSARAEAQDAASISAHDSTTHVTAHQAHAQTEAAQSSGAQVMRGLVAQTIPAQAEMEISQVSVGAQGYAPEAYAAGQPFDAQQSGSASLAHAHPIDALQEPLEQPLRKDVSEVSQWLVSDPDGAQGDADSYGVLAERRAVSGLGQSARAVVTQATEPRIPEPWVTTFAEFLEQHGRHPDQEELAEELYARGHKARGKDAPVRPDSVRRYYPHLQQKFPLPDQSQFELEGIRS